MPREEIVDVIDHNNKVIGQMPLRESYEKQISHRVVHTMLVWGEKIYLPQRSLTVSYMAGHYCSSAGGHLQAGESAEAGALRELKEEIGLKGPLQQLEDFFFVHEFQVHVSLFLKYFQPETESISIDPNEVLGGSFYTWDEIAQLDRNLFHPQLETVLLKLKKHILKGNKK